LFETDPDNPDEKSDRPLNFQINARSKIHDQTVRVVLDRARSQERPTWWSISGHPKFDSGGKFEGYRGSAKDVFVAGRGPAVIVMSEIPGIYPLVARFARISAFFSSRHFNSTHSSRRSTIIGRTTFWYS
jgi:hypothetical protein